MNFIVILDIFLHLLISAEVAILIYKIGSFNQKEDENCGEHDTPKRSYKTKKRVIKSPSYRALDRFRDNGY